MSGRADDALLTELAAARASGNLSEALALIRAMPESLRQQFDVLAHEADLLEKLGRHAEGEAILHRLIAREPTIAGLRLSLANVLKTIGRGDEAVAAAKSALTINRTYGRAWWMLADLKTYRFGEGELAAMQEALRNPLRTDDRRHLHFALGRAHEQYGHAELAFRNYAEGNNLASATGDSAPDMVTQRVDRAIAQFTPTFFAKRHGFGHDSDAPIFIVGLHRSGSTVVEQILASHSSIEATAELPIIAHLLSEIGRDDRLAGATPLAKLASIDRERATRLGGEYLRRATEYRISASPRFVDKMPANWLYVGFIRLILPNATIIDARRHPMAAGYSNFRQNYGKGVGWSYSLDSIGRYYRDYLRLMRHIDRVIPGKVHRVINERLIEDFESEVRKLLDHVGVAFEPECLQFHKSNRPVRSASAEQVRRPVNREGVDQWRLFTPWLRPLERALGPALENWQE